MANYQAIAAVSAAIGAVLERTPVPAMPHPEIRVVSTAGLQAPPVDGVTIYLYRVTANVMLRGANEHGGAALDLHYLVTAWPAEPLRQQALLGWAVRALDQTPLLTAALLNSQTMGSDVFRDDDSVQIALEPLSIADEGAIWIAAAVPRQISASYVARIVRLDSPLT
jgi:hypothetical protein